MIARVRGVIAEGLPLNVGKDRRGVGFHDCGGRGQERVGRHDDLVAGLNPRGQQCDSQRDGAAHHRHGVLCPVVVGKAALKAGHLVTVQAAPLAAVERP
jgi:hypothetical protein